MKGDESSELPEGWFGEYGPENVPSYLKSPAVQEFVDNVNKELDEELDPKKEKKAAKEKEKAAEQAEARYDGGPEVLDAIDEDEVQSDESDFDEDKVPSDIDLTPNISDFSVRLLL